MVHLLMCSDGFYSHIYSDEGIGEAVIRALIPSRVCCALLAFHVVLCLVSSYGGAITMELGGVMVAM